MVCGSGLVEGPSVCGAAVCVQLIGASTMAGCRGQKESVYIRWLNCVEQGKKHVTMTTENRIAVDKTNKKNIQSFLCPQVGLRLNGLFLFITTSCFTS